MRVPGNYIEKGAEISACGRYRHRLWREWRGSGSKANWEWHGVEDGSGEEFGQPKSCVFIMLNPSTADGSNDDPTIRRCVGFAKAWEFDRIEVVNLFDYRTTSPKALLALPHHENPCSPGNQEHIERAVDRAGLIVCAWGAHGGHLDQDETVLGWIEDWNPRRAPVVALSVTKGGFPGHPLYLPATARAAPYGGRR